MRGDRTQRRSRGVSTRWNDYALVLNAGSSSLKFCVYQRPEAEAWQLEARGQIEGIGTAPRFIREGRRRRDARRSRAGCRRCATAAPRSMPRGLAALRVRRRARARRRPSRRPRRRAIHRPDDRHAARSWTSCATLIPLAPLHQPYNLAAIEAVCERLPDVPQVACFDTSFHRGQPAVAEAGSAARELCDAGVQRYGFHGLSYEYIASVLPQVAPEIADGRVIVAHLGSGASLCALKNGKSVDSTLGFTALDGLCMGTRPGASIPASSSISSRISAVREGSRDDSLQEVRPARHLRHQQRHARPARRARARSPPRSRLLRLSRREGDRRADGGARRNRRAGLHRRHRRELRRDPARICEASAWLGIELDDEANARKAPRISTPDSRSRPG